MTLAMFPLWLRVLFGAYVTVFLLFFPAANTGAQNVPEKKSQASIITDVSSWSHPAKAVFLRHKVKLTKVEVSTEKPSYTFHVTFPYDPQSSATASYFNKLYAEISAAVGGSPYALLDEQDRLRIEVSQRTANKALSIELVPL
jgi:hypothetical protein